MRSDFINMVRESDDMKFVSYEDIDFRERYVVTKQGYIISCYTMKPIKPAFKNGHDKYKRVVLMDSNGKQHMIFVHRIVAIAFIPNPNNYPIINHKDEDPSNNSVDNLEWCTYLYNCTYNDVNIKRGKRLSETIKRNGGHWNKGKKF